MGSYMQRKRGGSGTGGGVREKPNGILAWSEMQPISQNRVCYMHVHCWGLNTGHGHGKLIIKNSFKVSDDYGYGDSSAVSTVESIFCSCRRSGSVPNTCVAIRNYL